MIIVAILFEQILANSGPKKDKGGKGPKEDKGDSCDANSCKSCTKDSDCVWCDSRCIGKDNKIGCTLRITDKKDCANDNADGKDKKGCDYKGLKYDIGEEFMDDCNSCTCKKGGKVSCSSNICFGCESVLCMEDTFCVEINNRPVCLPLNNPCQHSPCGSHFKCFVNAYGLTDCIPDPCMTVRCGYGKKCAILSDGTAGCVSPTCIFNGLTYKHGQSFPSDDGCNHCYCSDGTVICTLMACHQPTCMYEYNTYQAGQTWLDLDGCNTCTCNDGEVECTDTDCESCEYDDDCDSDSFCLISGCSSLLQGICSKCNPDILCTLQYDPVCGCDGNTYGNDCEATRACVNFEFGECLDTSCLLHGDCGDQSYCSKGSCSDYDLGVCIDLPIVCTKQFEPVCGCDGHTYNNPCLAAFARVNVASVGACVTLPFP